MALDRDQCQVAGGGDGLLKGPYWIGAPPEGAAESLPAPLIEAPACQIVPVVLVKKWRVPVVIVRGSAQAWNPDATLVAPLHAVNPETAVPASETV